MLQSLFPRLAKATVSRRSFLSALISGSVFGGVFGNAAARAAPPQVVADQVNGSVLNRDSTVHLSAQDYSDFWTASAQLPGGILSTRQNLQKAKVGPNVLRLKTLGYSAPDDGGGALYYRARADRSDPSQVRSADGAWWAISPATGSINIRQFGARGDGQQDDTQSIRDACHFARRSSEARTLLFPAGRYLVTGPLLELGPNDNRLAFRGQDAETTHILLGADLDTALIRIEGAPDKDRVEWVTFSELSFINRKRRYRGDCVHINQAYHIDWLRCRWIGWNGHALYLDDYWDSNFDGCRVIGCGAPSARDAERANVPFTAPKSAVWIGSSSKRVTSNNLNFMACQFESSWHNQMRLQDLVRRVHLVSCKFHGNQRADITESQLWIGGAVAGKIMGSVFAHAQASDHVEFALADGSFHPKAWAILGCDFSYCGGAAVRIRDGSHISISSNNFGQIGVNTESIVIEETVPDGPNDRQIAMSMNSFAHREKPPRVARPIVVEEEIRGRLVLRPQDKNGEAQAILMHPFGYEEGGLVDVNVSAKSQSGTQVTMSKQRTVVSATTPSLEAGRYQLLVQQNGQLSMMLELDGEAAKVRSKDTLHIEHGRWDGAHLQLGACHMWVDSRSELRMKMSAPLNDFDGKIIG